MVLILLISYENMKIYTVAYAFFRYAEMRGEEKNGISHRYRALEKLRAYLQPASTT